MQDILQHKDFLPTDLVYGFLGKHPKITEHRYNNSWSASNRSKVLELLGSNHSCIALVNQVHGAICANIKSSKDIDYDLKGDAQVTKDSSILIAVRTADCVPVLFADQNAKVIGVAHAGWKGALNGILISTLEQMKEAKASYNNIIAIIGPCIRQDSYEVDIGFMAPFLNEDTENKKFFYKAQSKEKLHFDLPGYVKAKLVKHLAKDNIYDSELDTLSNSAFYSHRRSCLAGEKRDGDNLSFIGLR